jgi:hypothetical protein
MSEVTRVAARFYIAKVEKFAYGGPGSVSQRSVTLQAATRGEENKSWAQATPSGQITMHINNGDAGAWFDEHLGEDIAVSFSLAPEAGPTKFS